MTKTLPPQNRINRGLNKVGERPGPWDFSDTIPHSPLYSDWAAAPRENSVLASAYLPAPSLAVEL